MRPDMEFASLLTVHRLGRWVGKDRGQVPTEKTIEEK